jgi:hypothetical protein
LFSGLAADLDIRGTQPSSDVSVRTQRWMKMRRACEAARRRMVTKADQEDILLDHWSALQTHLQGVDRATLAIAPKRCRHRAALLSLSIESRQNSTLRSAGKIESHQVNFRVDMSASFRVLDLGEDAAGESHVGEFEVASCAVLKVGSMLRD